MLFGADRQQQCTCWDSTSIKAALQKPKIATTPTCDLNDLDEFVAQKAYIECFPELSDDRVLSGRHLTSDGKPLFGLKLQQSSLTPGIHCSLHTRMDQ